MTPHALLHGIIRPALMLLEGVGGPSRHDREAERMLLAIAIQESGLAHRVQMGGGPATSLWQFERGGGVAGVLRHRLTKAVAHDYCSLLLTEAAPASVHACMVNNDILACGFARLLLLTDPFSLPVSSVGGWACYLRTWRPGKPRPEKWTAAWGAAVAAVAEAQAA